MNPLHPRQSCEMKRKPLLAAVCLLCAYLTFKYPTGLSGTEFSAGWLTGRLLDASFLGFFAFAASVLLGLVWPRIAAVTALIASVISFPLYLYFVMPGLYRQIFRGPWSVPLQSYFVADVWALVSLLAILAAMAVSTYVLLSLKSRNSVLPTPSKAGSVEAS